jgi:23S rRNA (adenine2030-N6)-methyltransferase
MNYRHAFHAGNFADCMKHALLVWLMGALCRKPGAVFVLDTHAGIGTYDLTGAEAQRTGEHRAGIDRLADPPLELMEYVRLVERLGMYPGSPALLRALLRPQDRMACCELHPEDAASLRRFIGRDSQISVHRRDAWEALGALLPPEQKRALVLIDPPYEAPDEFTRLADGLLRGHRLLRSGVFAAWYPIKHRAPVREFFHTLRQSGMNQSGINQSGMRDIVTAELWLRAPLDASRLNGCGLVVINPPFGFEAAASDILQALLGRLGQGEAGAGFTVDRIVDE